MKIVMIETTPGSPNGISVQHYQEGTEYDLPESLATVFIDMGVAKSKEEKPVVAEPAIQKKLPQNKAFRDAPNNKGSSNGKKKGK